ncbi:MAG: cytochrome c3 family protein [Bacteroidetes bacterium]|nr:cytochrome c3 family protein [Bacteroidota bacterium]
MRKLSSLILLLALSVSLFSQSSPHGDGFAVNCMDCHNTAGWTIDMKTLVFDHSTTKFPLTGQHQAVNCKLCHTSLDFTKAGTECVSCHTDMHNQTLGPDCGRCHTPVSWVVNNITELHQKSRFPLVGKHLATDCFACHKNASASLLNFAPLGVECIDCHKAPVPPQTDHSKFSTNCTECHSMNAFSWTGASINHGFFPLTGGHKISNCQECHKNSNYSEASPICFTCHEPTYNGTSNPNHNTIGFSTSCKDCHTTNPGWKPAEYREHDAKSFPIYSGKHNGTWNSCAECHTNPASYAQFTCIDCHDHNQPDMNGQHGDVQGYAYNSPACFACHPTGSKEGSFSHNSSPFPLTGAHSTTECIKCHANGYPNTPTTCVSCHMQNFNQSVNPNHAADNIPTDCGTCHTTQPGWKPATFPIHDNYYIIAGAHIPIANDCAKCHQGNYANTPKLCFGCHSEKYNQSTNPNHITANFPTTCETCHSQTAWSPSTFNHNITYPLTGAHATIANNCFACHQGSYVNTPNTCAGCHTPNYNASTNPNHAAINIPTTCITCHTTNPNWTPATFPIHSNYYVLAGAHVTVSCIDCHNGNYNATPNTCVGCHQTNYNLTNNPPHAASQFPTTCADCHTQTAWSPANWNHDGLYFPIYSGKHKNNWSTCSDCHTNPANYAVFTCTTSCHPQSSMNNKHQGISGYSYNSVACLSCHPQGNTPKLMKSTIDSKE